MLLRQVYEREKDRVIEKLLSLHFYKMRDGRELYQCALSELEQVLKTRLEMNADGYTAEEP